MPGMLSRFAHLARGPVTARELKAEERDEDEREKDASAEDEDDDKDKKDAGAEGDDDDKSASEDDEEDDKKDASEGDDDDDDDKKDARGAEARGRRAERARCATIFAAPEAAGNIALAAHLAFETALPAKAAIGALRAGDTTRLGVLGLSARMASVQLPRLGADGDATNGDRTTPDGNADFILNAGRRPRAAAKQERR